MTRIVYPQSSEIIYLEANLNYTIFHLKNGKKILSSSTLKVHETSEQLEHFLRVHKSFLLNPTSIVGYTQKGKKAVIELNSGTKVQVARRKLSVVKTILKSQASNPLYL